MSEPSWDLDYFPGMVTYYILFPTHGVTMLWRGVVWRLNSMGIKAQLSLHYTARIDSWAVKFETYRNYFRNHI